MIKKNVALKASGEKTSLRKDAQGRLTSFRSAWTLFPTGGSHSPFQRVELSAACARLGALLSFAK